MQESVARKEMPLDWEPSETRRILCATDLTPRSDIAIARAAALARELNAEVTFVHAVDGLQSGRVMRLNVARAHARLLTTAERAMAHAPDKARVSVRVGTPLQAIGGASAEWFPDLIVMTRPQRHTMDIAMGTTAERIIRATRRPVLIVGGQVSGPYSNVVVATDLSETSVQVARTVGSLGLLRDAHTWVVHAFDVPYYGMLESRTQEYVDSFAHQPRYQLEQTFLAELADHGVDMSKVRLVVQASKPFEAIERCLSSTRAELLVIGTSRWFMLKRLLFGSIADEVLRRVECDVLAITPRARKTRTTGAEKLHRGARPSTAANSPTLHA
jgi:universal stress protein E